MEWDQVLNGFWRCVSICDLHNCAICAELEACAGIPLNHQHMDLYSFYQSSLENTSSSIQFDTYLKELSLLSHSVFLFHILAL